MPCRAFPPRWVQAVHVPGPITSVNLPTHLSFYVRYLTTYPWLARLVLVPAPFRHRTCPCCSASLDKSESARALNPLKSPPTLARIASLPVCQCQLLPSFALSGRGPRPLTFGTRSLAPTCPFQQHPIGQI